jgi:hypothetical protein
MKSFKKSCNGDKRLSSPGWDSSYIGKLLDILGPRSTEHERLTIRPDLRNDLSDLRLETHVQHTVCLIQDKVRDAAKVGLLGFQHVDETTGSGDDDFDTSGEVTNLRTLGSATINCSVANPRVRTNECQNSNPDQVKEILTQTWCTLVGSERRAHELVQGSALLGHLRD